MQCIAYIDCIIEGMQAFALNIIKILKMFKVLLINLLLFNRIKLYNLYVISFVCNISSFA